LYNCQNNTIKNNLIINNKEDGIKIENASHNTIKGNLIGTDINGLDSGNYERGIKIVDNSNHNIIGPNNIIAYNLNGVDIGENSTYNTITQNSIYNNREKGIKLCNRGIAAPFITDFDLGTGTIAGATYANCTVEIFSDGSDEGEIYEGRTTADGAGFFTFNKGTSFTGPCLTATATDTDGNTSEFSAPTSGTRRSSILQEENDLPKTPLQHKQSRELEDNRIGAFFSGLWQPEKYLEVFPESVLDAGTIFNLGLKRVRLAINDLDWDRVDWTKPEFSIDPGIDDFITSLADNGITITYVLSFWDKEKVAGGKELQCPRFKTENQIQRYLDFVRFIVHHFKDRIQYYEIWNEPDIRDTIQWIEVEDYVNLVRRAVPVIRQEYPEAKIVVGSTPSLFSSSRDYLFTILGSDIMPLVDVVEWHPMYTTSPEYDREYYYNYPSIVQKIKRMASSHGFEGEYEGDELTWRTPEHAIHESWTHTYSEIKCAKYLARSIVMHLGMDVAVTQIGHYTEQVQLFHTIQNLCTIMAGAEPISLPVKIQSKATNIKSYSFSLSNGNKLIALWTDGVAVDDDPGVKATLISNGFSPQKVMGIDVLNDFEQQLVTNIENGNLVIRNLLVKDYPIVIRLIDITSS